MGRLKRSYFLDQLTGDIFLSQHKADLHLRHRAPAEVTAKTGRTETGLEQNATGDG